MNPSTILAARQALAQFDSHQDTLSGITLRMMDRVNARSNGEDNEPEMTALIDQIVTYIQFADKAMATVRNYLIASQVLTPAACAATSAIVNTNKNPSDLKTAATIIGPEILGSILGNVLIKNTMRKHAKAVGLDANREIMDEINSYSVAKLYSPQNLRKLIDLRKNAENTFATLEAQFGVVEHDELENALAALKGSAMNFVIVFIAVVGVSTLSSFIAAYHGYKRNNDSLAYALSWLFTGTNGLAVALQQGYAKPLNQKLIP